MEKKFLECVKQNNIIIQNDKVGIALSGGVDSVVLAYLLNKFKDELGCEIVAIHVNHNIRGAEANRDENFCKEYCKSLGIRCVVVSVDALGYAKTNKISVEESARILRYNEFDRIIKTENLTKIALAHHADDQAETVLMHLFRGSGLTGLSGMGYTRGNFIRPMLDIAREDIEKYAQEHNLSFVFDSTNNDENYSRNYIRKVVLPAIEKCFSGAKANIVSCASKLSRVDRLVGELLPKDVVIASDNEVKILNKIAGYDNDIQTQLVYYSIKNVNNGIDIEEKHIKSILKLFKAQVGKRINLPNNIVAQVVNGGVCVFVEKDNNFVKKCFKPDQEIECGMGKICVSWYNGEPVFNAGKLYIDADNVPVSAVWRTISVGDKFTKFSGGTKLLSDYLTDKKIDSKTRKSMVILADGENCLVIPGVEISKSLKITEKTKSVVEICLKK